jgi:hypothetical protein
MNPFTHITSAENEMIEGYWDGKSDDRDDLPEHSNFSEAYKHGWRNGRDDRLHRPRATAAKLREAAQAILSAPEVSHD